MFFCKSNHLEPFSKKNTRLFVPVICDLRYLRKIRNIVTFFSAIQYGCFAFCEQEDVKKDPPVFIMKSMNNEKMGQIQGESRLLDIKMIVNRTESV